MGRRRPLVAEVAHVIGAQGVDQDQDDVGTPVPIGIEDSSIATSGQDAEQGEQGRQEMTLSAGSQLAPPVVRDHDAS